MAESPTQQSDPSAAKSAKAPYEAPQLRALGDVRDMTLGGSPGTGDSGNPGLQKF